MVTAVEYVESLFGFAINPSYLSRDLRILITRGCSWPLLATIVGLRPLIRLEIHCNQARETEQPPQRQSKGDMVAAVNVRSWQ